MSILRSILKAAAALAMTASAYATTAGVNFTQSGTTGGGIVNGSGLTTTRSWTIDGPEGPITIIATAWSLADGGTFAPAEVGHLLGWGLGVCNPLEGIGCVSPDDRVDNSGGIADFVLFQFSVPVNLISTTLSAIDQDSDATFWVGSLNQTLAGLSLADLTGAGLGAAQNSDSDAAFWRSMVLVGNNGVQSLLVGARVGAGQDGITDSFTIADLFAYTNPGDSRTSGPIYTPEVPGGVPEPSSVIMIGSALLALGLVRRRSR